MADTSAKRLLYICDIITALLNVIADGDFTRKPAPGKWSKQEIMGYLTDSTANNHQRFVRTQFEEVPFIIYEQDG